MTTSALSSAQFWDQLEAEDSHELVLGIVLPACMQYCNSLPMLQPFRGPSGGCEFSSLSGLLVTASMGRKVTICIFFWTHRSRNAVLLLCKKEQEARILDEHYFISTLHRSSTSQSCTASTSRPQQFHVISSSNQGTALFCMLVQDFQCACRPHSYKGSVVAVHFRFYLKKCNKLQWNAAYSYENNV